MEKGTQTERGILKLIENFCNFSLGKRPKVHANMHILNGIETRELENQGHKLALKDSARRQGI
jgi:hypothetical protein